MKKLVILIFIFCSLTLGAKDKSDSQTKGPVSFNIEKPEFIKPGDRFEVKIVFSTLSGWYIYAPTGKNKKEGMTETSVLFECPEGASMVDNLIFPPPMPKGMYEVLEGKNITFKQKFKADSLLKGEKIELKASVTFQTCNSDMCLPPQTNKVKLIIHIK